MLNNQIYKENVLINSLWQKKIKLDLSFYLKTNTLHLNVRYCWYQVCNSTLRQLFLLIDNVSFARSIEGKISFRCGSNTHVLLYRLMFNDLTPKTRILVQYAGQSFVSIIVLPCTNTGESYWFEMICIAEFVSRYLLPVYYFW